MRPVKKIAGQKLMEVVQEDQSTTEFIQIYVNVLCILMFICHNFGEMIYFPGGPHWSQHL